MTNDTKKVEDGIRAAAAVDPSQQATKAEIAVTRQALRDIFRGLNVALSTGKIGTARDLLRRLEPLVDATLAAAEAAAPETRG